MTRTHYIILAIFAALCALTGCTLTTEQKSAWQRLALNALGRVATAELQTLAKGEGDYAHSAAEAVWTTDTIADIFNVIRAAGASPALASRAQDVANAAVKSGLDKRTVLNAVASAISTGAN